MKYLFILSTFFLMFSLQGEYVKVQFKNDIVKYSDYHIKNIEMHLANFTGIDKKEKMTSSLDYYVGYYTGKKESYEDIIKFMSHDPCVSIEDDHFIKVD